MKAEVTSDLVMCDPKAIAGGEDGCSSAYVTPGCGSQKGSGPLGRT